MLGSYSINDNKILVIFDVIAVVKIVFVLVVQ